MSCPRLIFRDVSVSTPHYSVAGRGGPASPGWGGLFSRAEPTPRGVMRHHPGLPDHSHSVCRAARSARTGGAADDDAESPAALCAHHDRHLRGTSVLLTMS